MIRDISHINSKHQIRRLNKQKLEILKISLKHGSQTFLKYRMLQTNTIFLNIRKCIWLTVLVISIPLVSIELLVTDFSTTKFFPKFKMSNFLLSLLLMIWEKVQTMLKTLLRNFLEDFPTFTKLKTKYSMLPAWWLRECKKISTYRKSRNDMRKLPLTLVMN
jgi:hypothetical protein